MGPNPKKQTPFDRYGFGLFFLSLRSLHAVKYTGLKGKVG